MAVYSFGGEFEASIDELPSSELRRAVGGVVREMIASSFEELERAASGDVVFPPGMQCWTRDVPQTRLFIAYQLLKSSQEILFVLVRENLYGR